VTLSPAAALAAPLRQFQAWHLRVSCRHCRVLVRLEVDRLVVQQGGATVGDVARRLRCSRCGIPPASVSLADGAQGEGRADFHQIELIPAQP
jgi:hypothetical protein